MRRFMQAHSEFCQDADAVYFDASALDQPVKGADPRLRHTLETLMGLAGINAAEHDLVARLRAEIAQGLGDQKCGIDELADAVGMTPRTLQRHLILHGLTFSSLRDQVRKERAVAMLTQTTLPIGEISYRLGFTEVSSFYRSFRSWLGVAPGRFRTEATRRAAQERAALAIHKIAERDVDAVKSRRALTLGSERERNVNDVS